MEILRTPEDRFANLPDYPFAANYRADLPGFAGLRMHYVDVGPQDAGTVFLCLHGQPTWSYLYRRMIPHFVATGARVVAPDLFGFGKSDKPAEQAFYSFTQHRNMLLAFIAALDLRHITLVVQDWGGILGLTLPMTDPARFERLLVMNTALCTGDMPLGDGFYQWRTYANSQHDLPIAPLLAMSTPHLSPAELAAYEAPFPDARYKAGVRAFPNLVADAPDADGAAEARAARRWWNESWRGQSFMAVGAQDPVLGPPVMAYLHSQIHGCPPAFIHPTAGHFVQEWGDEVAQRALAAWAEAAPAQ